MTRRMLEIRGSAIFSSCDRYRYVLRRRMTLPLVDDDQRTCLFIMLNPSTADATTNDPTVRKCIGFAQRWGYSKLTVGNIYALRSTDPKALWLDDEPVGAFTFDYLRRLASEADRIVCAWGAHADPIHAARCFEVIEPYCRRDQVVCLGRTKQGFPKHPLYIPYEATVEVFQP